MPMQIFFSGGGGGGKGGKRGVLWDLCKTSIRYFSKSYNAVVFFWGGEEGRGLFALKQ